MADIPVEAVALMGELMAASHEHTTHILSSCYVEAEAQLQCITDGVNEALATNVWGGTAREYEMVLSRIANALYPSHERLAKYREKVEQSLHVHSV